MFGFSFHRNQESDKDSDFVRSMFDAYDSLDIEVAISAHENWKIRLQAYLDGKSSETFDRQTVCLDNKCDLGKWIHGPGQERLGKYPGFMALVNSHKMFHYAASNVVTMTQAGKPDKARATLEGQFDQLSTQVVGILKALQKARAYRRSK
jgi:hypothetical protein